jgi:hypothetical protein
MDPYIEHPDIWEDFHLRLANEISDQLTPELLPSYYAAVIPRVTYEEVAIASKPHRAIPDVGIYQVSPFPVGEPAVAIAPAPLVMDAPTVTFEVHAASVEIRTTSEDELVTAIEILSRANKRVGSDGWGEYQSKRRALIHGNVHLLEIDLLRAGKRTPIELEQLPAVAYFVFLKRNTHRSPYEIWPIPLSERLPIVPVPLNAPDPDVPLDLNKAVHAIYDRAAYFVRIDYRKSPPEPALSADEAQWLEERLQAKRQRAETSL